VPVLAGRGCSSRIVKARFTVTRCRRIMRRCYQIRRNRILKEAVGIGTFLLKGF
jgi:hypothetical protein